jgi:Ala-tRNA(Pro) deacylase
LRDRRDSPFSFSSAIELIVDPEWLERFDEIAFDARLLDQSVILASAGYLRISRTLVRPLCA